MQLADLFASALLGQADDVAIEYEGADGEPATLRFGDLHARSNRLARAFARRGLQAGDRVGVYLSNRIEFVDLLLACIKLGLVLVPINILYREREIGHILGDAQPRVVVTTRDAIEAFGGASPLDVTELTREAAAESGDDVRTRLDGGAPAAIVYTSGTTGRSKGAVLSHDNFLANTVNLVACWRITASDRYLAVLPLFQPTLLFGVPTVYVRLLELPRELAYVIGSRMRLFVSGSAPLPPAVLDEFRTRFGHTILERYGMSETLMNLSNPYAGERRAGSVGMPLPGLSTRIIRPDGTEAATGEVGELLVRGPNVFSGYWRQPEATAAAFVDGWFRTGDLAERSEDGYYTLRGRRTDLIISGGFNIYPREIEELLLEVPGVREAVVVGVADARRGELPVAYLVTDQPIDPPALEDRCRRALASFKVPRAFVRVDALPRTALGKVQKHLLPPWRQ
jgi:malonyl-CoA/methylmalonyl-CoA synthetase